MNTVKERILIIENDPTLSDLIGHQTLEPLGYKIQLIQSAASAIQEVSRFSPDAIIANLNLPGLSGKDLLVALTSQSVEVPVIVLAEKGMEGDVIQAFRLGATDFIYAPIREAEVVSAVERVLKQGRAKREREILARQLKQTNQELQRRVRELTTIFAIGKAVISAPDLKSLFDKIVEGAVFVTEADFGWFLMRDEKSKVYILRAHRNLPNHLVSKMNQPWDDGISSLVALSGESLSIHGEPLERFKISSLGKSALVVPIKVRKDVAGLLVVARKADLAFGSSQQALLEAVSDYASVALVNSSLLGTLQEKVSTLQQSTNVLQISTQIKDSIISEVNDEFRNTMMIIKGNVDILTGSDINKLTAEQRSTVEIIQDKLHNILDAAEALADIDQFHLSNERRTVNLTDVIQREITRFQSLAGQHNITLTAEVPPRAIFVLGVPGQLSKVMDGLLSNAIKFNPMGGPVTLRARYVTGSSVQVTVQDTGIGIASQHIPHIFDRSYQVSNSTPPHYGGIGIKLSLIKDIIQAHGGKVWADSQPGVGSSFHFTLPTSTG